MEEVSLHVDAGEGGGPISVFTSSGLLSVLTTRTSTTVSILFLALIPPCMCLVTEGQSSYLISCVLVFFSMFFRLSGERSWKRQLSFMFHTDSSRTPTLGIPAFTEKATAPAWYRGLFLRHTYGEMRCYHCNPQLGWALWKKLCFSWSTITSVSSWD